MVKLPKKTFEIMLLRYRVAGTFENLSKQYAASLAAKDKTIEGLRKQISAMKDKIKNLTEFISVNGLMDRFMEYIKPKSLKEKLEMGKRKSREKSQQKENLPVVAEKKHNIAI